jgi:signal transduction histidine kinase
MDRRDKLIEAALTLHSELSLAAVLQRIIELAAEITDARYGAVGVIGPRGRLVEFITTGITPEEREAIGDPPVGHGILGVLIREAHPVRIRDITTHPHSFGFPPNHPPMHSFLGAPIEARGEVFGNIYLAEKQFAEEFSEEDERAIELLAAQAGVAIENARLYEEAGRRARMLEAMREISNAILSRAETSEVLDLIARRARELVGADLASVHVPVPGALQLVVEAADGELAETVRGERFPIEGSISGEVVRAGRAIVVDDASKDPRAYQPLVRLQHMGPAVFVPLTSQGKAFGTLAAANEKANDRERRGFSADDVSVLEAFGAQAALALDYEGTRAELERLLVLEDRERIAKELHDGVIQALFAVGMGLQGTALMSGDPELGERIEGAVGELDRVIRDLRNYIFGLRPGILADRQLDQALRHLGDEFQQRSGVVTVVEVDATVAAELSNRAGDLVQLVRESLSNVGRHAQATTVRVSLFRRDDHAVVEVDDDGTGFDTETATRGEGLTNLEKRVEALGGKATIQSTPGLGTTVLLELPL